jgi:uncharacterized protein (TIGR01244 family)
MSIYQMSEVVSVASQIRPADVEAIAGAGFATIVCNRPDGEDFGQPTASEVAAQCEAHGVAFHHIPVHDGGLSIDVVDAFRDVVAGSKGPVLAYCRSGQRSSILWQVSGAP